MSILYSKLKVFHFQDKLDSLPREVAEIHAPLYIRIKPTNLCNHRCRYCAYSDRPTGSFGKDAIPRTYIPREKMLEIIEDLVDMGVKAVTFSGGGEPFTYPHFREVVQRLSETPIRFGSLTNGSLLHGEVAEIFAAHGTWIRVSMDGWDDASYSAYRGVPDGSFTKLMNNMRTFKRLSPKCYLGVSYIIDQSNAPHVYDFMQAVKDIGVDSIKLSACLTSEHAQENNAYHKPFFAQVKDQIGKALAELRDDSFEIFDAYNELDGKFAKTYTWCPYLQILPIIGADLNVYACPDKAYNTRTGLIGSIRDRRFKEFWHADKDKFFRIDPSRDCLHHCETNHKNKLVLEYLDLDREHLFFV